MSTRCNVAIIDRHSFPEVTPIMMYRHGDGYPDGVAKSLCTFVRWINARKLRDNASQSAGWLVLIGLQEYLEFHVTDFTEFCKAGPREQRELLQAATILDFEPRHDFGIGSYSPTRAIHGDIAYLHVVYAGDCENNQSSAVEAEKDAERLAEWGVPWPRAFWQSFYAAGNENAEFLKECIVKTLRVAGTGRAADPVFESPEAASVFAEKFAPLGAEATMQALRGLEVQGIDEEDRVMRDIEMLGNWLRAPATPRPERRTG